MPRKFAAGLLALSLGIFAPAEASAAALGKTAAISAAGAAGTGAAGAGLSSLSPTLTLALPSNGLGLPSTLPSVSVPAPSVSGTDGAASVSVQGTVSAGGTSDSANAAEKTATPGFAPRDSHRQAAPKTGGAGIPGSIVLGAGAQVQGRDTPRVRFDGRAPARGVYAGRGFKALKKRVLAWTGRHWDLPVDELLAANDVLVLGEAHTSLSSIEALADNAGRLKAAGVSVIGIEGLKAPDQAAVDDYLEGRASEIPAVFPSRQASFARLMQAARAEGLRVRALGRPLSEVASDVAERAAELSGDRKSFYDGDLGGQIGRAEARYEFGLSEAVAENVLTGRNAFMAGRLADDLRPGEKAVALVGAAHAEHPSEVEFRLWGLDLAAYGSLASSLRDRALSAFSLTLTGGLFEEPARAGEHRMLLAPLYDLAEAAAGVFLPTSESTGLLNMGAAEIQGRAKAEGKTTALDEAPKVTTHGLLYLVAPGAASAAAAFWGLGILPGAVMLSVGALFGSAVALYFFGDFAQRMIRAWWKASRRFKAVSALSTAALGAGLFFFHAPVLAFLAAVPATIYFYAIFGAALTAAGVLRWRQKKTGTVPKNRGRISGRRLLAGLLLGLLLGTGTIAARTWLVPVAHRFLNTERDTTALSYERAPGAMQNAMIRHFEASESGRELLSRFRDRFGVVRLPHVYMTGRGNPHYVPMYDSVFLPADVADIADWDDYVSRQADTLYHELWHAVQARRGFITSSSEYEREQEAYIRQNLHLYDLWSKDPGALGIGTMRTADFAEFATDLDKYLKNSLSNYDVGRVGPDDPFHAWFKKWRAEEYPRIQVVGLKIAAERYLYHADRPWYDRAASLYRLALEKAQALGDSELEQAVRESIAKAQENPKFSLFPQLAQPRH